MYTANCGGAEALSKRLQCTRKNAKTFVSHNSFLMDFGEAQDRGTLAQWVSFESLGHVQIPWEYFWFRKFFDHLGNTPGVRPSVPVRTPGFLQAPQPPKTSFP